MITVEKATKVLVERYKYHPNPWEDDWDEALQLGIKALEFGIGYFGATNFLYLIEHPDKTKEGE